MAKITPSEAKTKLRFPEANYPMMIFGCYTMAVGGVIMCVFIGLSFFNLLNFHLLNITGTWSEIVFLVPAVLGTSLFVISMLPQKLPEMFCPHCDKFISKDTNWTCGYCDFVNKDTASHPFIAACKRCSREASAYVCHHCSKPIKLDGEFDVGHAAQIFPPVSPPEAPSIDPRELKESEHLDKKVGLEREIEIAALSKRLAQLKLSPEFKQELSEAEKIDKDFSNFDAQVMGLQMLERNRRREYAMEFKSDPELLEMKNLALDEYMERNGLTPNRYDK